MDAVLTLSGDEAASSPRAPHLRAALRKVALTRAVLFLFVAAALLGALLLLLPQHRDRGGASSGGCAAFYNSTGHAIASCAACAAPWLVAFDNDLQLCRCMAECGPGATAVPPASTLLAPAPPFWTPQHDAEARAARGVSLVIGLGTGRCGTTTLSHVLRSQRGTKALFSHELHPVLPWPPSTLASASSNTSTQLHLNLSATAAERVAQLLRRAPPRPALRYGPRGELLPSSASQAAHIGAPATLVGDVASFYLPYVREMLRAEPGARFVVLQRKKKAVIASFLAKDPGVDLWSACLGREKWSENHGYWATAHPKFECSPELGRAKPALQVRASLDSYWELYAAEGAGLARAFPDRVRVVESPRIFKNHAEMRDLLRWLGFESPNVEGRIGRYNGGAGRAKGGKAGPDEVLGVVEVAATPAEIEGVEDIVREPAEQRRL